MDISRLTIDELKDYLQTLNRLKPQTLQNLQDEEVDGEAFLLINEANLQKNFSDIKAGERFKVLQLVEEFKRALPQSNDEQSSSSQLDDSASSSFDPLPVEIVFVESNECTAPMVSTSVRKTVESPPPSETPSTSAVEQVMDVKDILMQSAEGFRVVENIQKNRWPDDRHRKKMISILTDYHVKSTGANRDSYYPNPIDKLMMAKGIIRDFPTLADNGNGEGYLAWYDPSSCKGFLGKKFEYLREKHLKPTEKRKIPKDKKKSHASSTTSSTMLSDHDNEDSPSKRSKTDENYDDMVKKLSRMEATSGSKNIISSLMEGTFSERHKWMNQRPKPSGAQILTKFIHFKSYGGLMITEEFQRLHPKAVAFDLTDIVNAVLQHSKSTKKKLYEDSSCLQNDSLHALQLIFDILPSVPVKRSKEMPVTTEETNNKFWIASKPCAALVQIVPAGTDVQGYQNKLQPIKPPSDSNSKQLMSAPFMLWLTDDQLTGEIYILIDGHFIHVDVDPLSDPFPKAFDVFLKLFHVLAVHYHPQLKFFFNFFEFVYGLNNKPIPSVRALVGALRTIQIETNNN
ncbi:uncharacterized protein LOC127750377 isoform X2 [Frankliniella occidentalis]|uniref:Uncharacterized protein LOC127750377 isoform X2 n=1 Tax=Frankliniella occidentalis TaxID=133901 RepID=A0A9C6X2H3_FRAOC|nr:uncharacterized protein LOC127750377 isoform X2 [Frankliniella occidentalis]